MSALLSCTDDEQFVLKVSPRYSDLARKVPGISWDRKTDTWRGPATWAAAIVLQGVFGDMLEPDEHAHLWSVGAKAVANAVLEHKQTDFQATVRPSFDGPFQLMEHQQRDSDVLCSMQSGLLLSEMRTGKSHTILNTIDMTDQPTLIICPNGVKRTWANHILQMYSDASIVIVGGTSAQRVRQLATEADFYIISYQLLPKHSRLAHYPGVKSTPEQLRQRELNEMQFSAVILDEAHRIKDHKAQQTRAAWAVGDASPHRYALTGTPIANNVMELWSLLRFAFPSEFPSRNKFLERYAWMEMNMWGGMECYGVKPEMRTEFDRIFEPKYIRRTTAEVLPWLPKKVYKTMYVEMEPKQRKAYEQMEASMLAVLESEILVATNPLTQALRLHQLAAATPVLEGGEVVDLTDPSCKIDALMEVLDRDPAQLIVFAESKKLISLCARRLARANVTHMVISGDVPEIRRFEEVEKFQAGELRVALVVMAAGSEGIDLSAAPRILYLQRSHNMVRSSQSEARNSGPMQTAKSIEIIDVITENTVEARLHEAVLGKEAQMHDLVKDREWVKRVFRGH